MSKTQYDDGDIFVSGSFHPRACLVIVVGPVNIAFLFSFGCLSTVICCLDCILRSDLVVVVISSPVVITCSAYLSAMVFPSHPECPFT